MSTEEGYEFDRDTAQELYALIGLVRGRRIKFFRDSLDRLIVTSVEPGKGRDHVFFILDPTNTRHRVGGFFGYSKP